MACRVMVLRAGPTLEMNERHMRRVLASECPDGVEPDPALVRRLSKRSFTPTPATGPTAPGCPTGRERACGLHWRLEGGREHLTKAMADGKGIVMALPHVGSWEWGGYWLALEGMPMTAVVEVSSPKSSSSGSSRSAPPWA